VRLFDRPLTAALSLITDRNLLSSIFLPFHQIGLYDVVSSLALAISYIPRPNAILIDIPLFLSKTTMIRDDVRASYRFFD